MNLRQANILVIDDDTDVLTAARLLLKPEAKNIVTNSSPENIRRLVTGNSFDVLLLDMNFNSALNTGNEGLYWLRQVKEWSPATAVIMITAYGHIDLAVRALKEGAADFIVKPWHNDKLLETIADALPQKTGKKPVAGEKNRVSAPGIIGESPVMQDIFHKIGKIAPTDANVLILGENGTGKDLVAKAIHERSLRRDKPFVKVDVGALTDSLFESELFGHTKGAFTDAREGRAGRFEAAQGGTLFLDEIGNISLVQQAKLLTVLQNRIISRVGSNEAIPVDIRLICATNVPINELADEQRFRKDLIYRINTVEIMMPALSRRGNDIVALANHFTRIYADKYLKKGVTMSPAALNKLQMYSFPGNVRELQYIVERAVIMADSTELQAQDLIFSPIESSTGESQQTHANSNLSEMEKNTILHVIDKHNGNISKAAKELGLTRTALYRRLNKYDI
ncbi:MAG: sigma-54 dependent transcriptional regulator [Bacteroidales bacterium]|jgi:DNA-binding NtrC family response regulator|nr:sigma-54 dependent transcriptional regulator [Bacteroidales bacterium]